MISPTTAKTKGIGLASVAHYVLNRVWKQQDIPIPLKLRVFNAAVLSIVLYGSEYWALTPTLTRRLVSFENRCLRHILGINWTDHVTNDEVRRLSGQPSIEITLRKRRLQWLGHLLRMPDSRPAKEMLLWESPGTQRKGKLRTRLVDVWRKDLESIILTVPELQ
ncbi:unnamed protein product [Didymodactylos carnosus]|uniref:Endonuclease-reverse transcriptase n=1 Tax=Didymodactylos carnosus TaxID=1234261 RepID=A0A815YPD7_9BILA|nr:unnamed protein product [Didymodactylos carnosus]CAF1572893.1 unnamed protein product [Didymodactylos carnosus]CAF3984221.1 unnamed protein product [Didymodactylos carnosus]CAF4436716.1 unnamed protein product [Didymodactylos carnosus]